MGGGSTWRASLGAAPPSTSSSLSRLRRTTRNVLPSPSAAIPRLPAPRFRGEAAAMSVYQSDLAAIHDRAFGDHPRRAATRAIAELRRRGIREGRVVELGCGSGITSALFHAAGHAVWGVDPSPAMIELSRQRLPAESFEVRSA